MKRGTMWLVAMGSLSTLAGVSMVLSLVLLLDNRELRGELARLRDSEQALQSVADRERAAAEAAVAAGEAERARAERLQGELSASQQASVARTNVPVRAQRAAVYLGRDPVGQAYVIPERPGVEAGSPPREAVVLLDESWKARLAAARAGSAVAETPAPVTVNHNYPGYPSGYTWWPYYWGVGEGCATNHPPRLPGQVPPATPPPEASGWAVQNRGIWRPTDRPTLSMPSTWPIVTTPQLPPVRMAPVATRPVPPPAPVRPMSPVSTRPLTRSLNP